MRYILPFSKISKNDVEIAGGKGASLGELAKSRFSVPPGFVVLAPAFERFLRETDINIEIDAALNKVNYQDINSVDQASKLIRDVIHDARMSLDLQKEILSAYDHLKAKWVAVRSSATAEDSSVASWAGELETYLNTDRKNLIYRVKDCWSSLFTQRAIVYRNEKGLHKSKVLVAVVVQKMIQAEVAGICFTTHPVTKDKNQLIIEAGWGLGEAIVGGYITPDSYVVDKRDWKILDINISEQEKMLIRKKSGVGDNWVKVPQKLKNKQKLDSRKIIELSQLCAKIERCYKFPCDIEWVMERGKFYIVQSRPITTL